MFYYSPFDVADLKNNFFKMFNDHKERDDYHLAVALGNIDTHRFGIANKAEKNEMSKFQTKVESIFGKGNVTDSSIKVAYAYFNMLNGFENSTFSNLQSNLRFDSDRLLEVLNAVDTMSGKWGQKDYFNKLKLRLTYGVSSDLVYLCMIPNVGKARAEKLWKAGIQSVEAFANTDATTLGIVMNLKEEKIKESLNGARLLRIKDAL
jgi:replicative superfamily II helicase